MKETLIKKLFGAVRNLKETKDLVRRGFKRWGAEPSYRARIPYIDEALALFNERVAVYPDVMPQETSWEAWGMAKRKIYALEKQILYELAEKYKEWDEDFNLCKKCFEELKALGDPGARCTYEDALALANQALRIDDRMTDAKARCNLWGLDVGGRATAFIDRAYMLGETPNHPLYSLHPYIPFISAPEVQTPSIKWEMGPEPEDLKEEIYDIEA